MKRTILLVVAVLLVSMIGVGIASAGNGKTVKTLGDEVLKPGHGIRADLRFSPGPVNVAAGDTITWVGADKAGAPHTVTLTRDPDLLVKTFSDFVLGTCPACDDFIDAGFGAHFGGPAGPVLVADGGDGFGDDGDSLLFGGGIPGLPNEITMAIDNVEPGETVFYTCIFHPWMQGTINVAG